MADAELLLRLSAENAQLKAALSEAQAKLEEFKASQAQIAPGAVEAAAALDQEATAASSSAVAADAHVVAYQAVQAANQRVVTGLQEVRAAFAANSSAIATGGAGAVAAVTAIADALGKVIAETVALRSAGGVVSPAQQAAIEGYILRLRELAVAGGLVATELHGVGAASNAAAAGGVKLGPVYTQGANALAGAKIEAGALGGQLLRLVGPLGLAAAGIALLPTLLDSVDSKTRKWSQAIVDLITGISDEDVAVKKLDKSTREAVASADLFVAAHRKGLDASRDFTTQINELGFRVRENFDSIKQRAQDFVSAYAVILKQEGVAAARDFAELNSTELGKIIDRYVVLGKAVPRELHAIADALGIVSDKEKEIAGNRELSKKWADEMSAANLLIGIIRSSVGAKEDEFAVTGRLAKQINEEITALERLKTTNAQQEADRQAALRTLVDLAVKHGILTSKLTEMAKAAGLAEPQLVGVGQSFASIANSDIPKIVAGSADVVVALNKIRDAAREADVATSALFAIESGGHSQLSSTGVTSGAHTSVGS